MSYPTGPYPLAELGEKINAINRANGWDVLKPEDWPIDGGEDAEVREIHKVRKIGTALALIHSEVSEALEALRKRDEANFAEELADVIIRVLDCACGMGIQIDEAVRDKMMKNAKRGFRHGGKAV